MSKTRMTLSSLWRTIYVRPMDWLCGLRTDKLLHFLVSMMLVQMVFFLTANLWLATVVTFLVGIFKEVVVDKLISKGCVDAGDLWADVFGICAGLLLLELAYILIKIHEWLW